MLMCLSKLASFRLSIYVWISYNSGTTTTTVHIELGAAFWLLIAVLIGGLVLWLKLGSEGMSRVIRGGLRDTFGG